MEFNMDGNAMDGVRESDKIENVDTLGVINAAPSVQNNDEQNSPENAPSQDTLLNSLANAAPKARRLLKNNQNLISFLQLGTDIAWVVASLCALVLFKTGAVSSDYRILALVATFCMAFVYSSQGIHRRSSGHLKSVVRISMAWFTVVAALAVLGFVTKTSEHYSRELLLTWLPIALFGQLAAYFCFSYLTRWYRSKLAHSIPTLVIGSGAVAQRLVTSLNGNHWVRDEVIAYIKVDGEPEIPTQKLKENTDTNSRQERRASGGPLRQQSMKPKTSVIAKLNLKTKNVLKDVPIIGKLSKSYLEKAPFSKYLSAAEATSDPDSALQLVVNQNKTNKKITRTSLLDLYTAIDNTEALLKLIKSSGIKRVYIALPMLLSQQVSKLNLELMDQNIDVIWAPDIYALNLVNHSVREVSGVPIISLNESPLTSSRLSTVLKGLMDRTLAALALIVLAPVMLLIAIAVKTSSKGPVLFKQQRHGWDGSVIKVWKFRSMRLHDEAEGEVKQATKTDSRITPVGNFIRRTSLDELPQFVNVLQGRMSLVGPRPHAVSHNNFYSKKINSYLARHRIKPGITGLAQISGCRGETETLDKMQKRVEYDLSYINNWSLWLDVKILMKTPFSLASSKIY